MENIHIMYDVAILDDFVNRSKTNHNIDFADDASMHIHTLAICNAHTPKFTLK